MSKENSVSSVLLHIPLVFDLRAASIKAAGEVPVTMTCA